MTIQSLHRTNEEKLAGVIDEMKHLGRPTIRVIGQGKIDYAIEGTHRLAAAHALYLIPNLIHLDSSAIIPEDIQEEMGTGEWTGNELVKNWDWAGGKKFRFDSADQ